MKAAKPERFPALALSRSGSKGISHPRYAILASRPGQAVSADNDAQRRTPALAADKIPWLGAAWQPILIAARMRILLPE
jgi:hypothetical protein